MRSRWVRPVLAVAAVAALVVAGWQLPLAEWITGLADRARGAGAVGVLLFAAAYVISTVALLPGSLLTVAAGFAYGPVWGLLLASPASVAGATCAFLLGRTVLRGWAARTVSASGRMRAIDRAVGADGFRIVLLLRLSPLFPFNLLNYALSLTTIPTGAYVLASFLGMLPATALFVYLGSLAPAAAQLASASSAGDGAARIALYAAGLLATIAVTVLASRAAKRALASELGDEGTPSP